MRMPTGRETGRRRPRHSPPAGLAGCLASIGLDAGRRVPACASSITILHVRQRRRSELGLRRHGTVGLARICCRSIGAACVRRAVRASAHGARRGDG
jgi:hypothetical protein